MVGSNTSSQSEARLHTQCSEILVSTARLEYGPCTPARVSELGAYRRVEQNLQKGAFTTTRTGGLSKLLVLLVEWTLAGVNIELAWWRLHWYCKPQASAHVASTANNYSRYFAMSKLKVAGTRMVTPTLLKRKKSVGAGKALDTKPQVLHTKGWLSK